MMELNKKLLTISNAAVDLLENVVPSDDPDYQIIKSIDAEKLDIAIQEISR